MAYTPSSVPACLRILIDVLLYLAGCGGVVVLKLLVDPVTQGFHCDDPSLRHKMVSDTITQYHMLFGGIVMPVAAILVLEIVFRLFLGRRWSFKSCLLATSKLTGMYLYGLLLCYLVTEVIKVCVGRPRPHFIDTCKPDFTALNCSQGYITDYTCTSGASDMQLRDARKSFPSGFSTFVFYAATFLVFYTEERVEIPFSTLLKSLCQLGLVLLAFFCASTRYSDSRHHLSDVVVGAALGLLLGIGTVFWVSKHMRRENFFSSVYKAPSCGNDDNILVREQTAVKRKPAPIPLKASTPTTRGPPATPLLSPA